MLKRKIYWFCTDAPKTRKSPLLIVTTGHFSVLRCRCTVVVKWWSILKQMEKDNAEFAKLAIKQGATIHTDGYRSYKKGVDSYEHQPKIYKPNTGLLHWLHIMISNAKAFILGTFHGLPKKNLDLYRSEFCFRFNRRNMNLFERLVVAVGCSFLLD